ncbi:MAG: molybdenum cofactor biosynthesis protein MoaE [Candidatus Bathyarchaeota archaeon]|nr:molybdenum cofactor biosynthesis protein MoaE [Candidatus Bathyarchaeota archaeon]
MTTQSGVHEKGTFTLLDAIENSRKRKPFSKAGAVATFTGVVRGESIDKKKVQKLTLEAYEEKANDTLNKICKDLMKKPGIVDVQIHHLLGDFAVGEDVVYVIVAGSHRKQVFAVLEEAVERYKTEAPIFKKEYVLARKGKINGRWVAEVKHT